MAIGALPCASPHARPLVHRSALELARAIRDRDVTARDVVEAHIEVLRRAQPRINALAAERFVAAREDADAADRLVAGGAGGLPPLLGVPCTIKEMIAVRGMPNCGGLVSRRHHRATETAPAAQRLADAGAIVLGVTNVAELGMWMESDNRVYGRTSNAYDPTRIAGGSSGGEGAAVGAGGAPIGLGSDSGGSVRLPAFFNGVFGHKPSPGLVPNTGQFPDKTGDIGRVLTIGPLARRAEDLMPVLRAIAGPDGRDPFTREVQLGDPGSVSLAGLPVALSEGAFVLPVQRQLLEARERAADRLAAAGARVHRVSLRSLRRAVELYLLALSGTGGLLHDVIVGAGSPRVGIRGALRRGGPHTIPTLLALAAERVPQPALLTRRIEAAGRSLAAEVDAATGEGVILHPPFPRRAPRHGATVARPWLLSATAGFSALGLPVTQVPLGLDARGLPLGVQVAAARDRDHVAIAVAMELERGFGGWVPPPRYPCRGWTSGF